MPSPVIGSTKPAASPASNSPGIPTARASTARGPSVTTPATWRARAHRSRNSGSRLHGVPQSRTRVGHLFARRRDQAQVGEAVRRRRDADVVSGAHVHLAERPQSVDALGVCPDRPAPRTRGMRDEAERDRQRGSPPVGGDRPTCRACARRGRPPVARARHRHGHRVRAAVPGRARTCGRRRRPGPPLRGVACRGAGGPTRDRRGRRHTCRGCRPLSRRSRPCRRAAGPAPRSALPAPPIAAAPRRPG